MNPEQLILLVAAAAANSVVPGPGMLLAVGRSAACGFRAGVLVSLGMALATLVLILLVWAVMAGALLISNGGLAVLRIVGVGVLTLLALALLVGTPVSTVASPGLGAGRVARLWLGDVGGGFATGLTSPVHLIFLLALLPQFIDLARLSYFDLALISAVIVLITTIPMLAASALGAASDRFGFGWARYLQRCSGLALLAFAGVAAMAGP
jgi:threonine/homoserine/homoserine lactone efflux protein